MESNKRQSFFFLVKTIRVLPFLFLERIRNVIKARLMDESICKSFLMAANQDNLPLDVVLDDDEVAYISNFVSSVADISLRDNYKQLTDEGKLLDNEWEADESDNTDQSVLNQITQSLFNFDFEKCYKLIKHWTSQSQYYQTIRFMIQASLRRKVKVEELENILTVHESHKYNNDQEYMVALELPLGLHEYFWGIKTSMPSQKRYNRKLKRLFPRTKMSCDFLIISRDYRKS